MPTSPRATSGRTSCAPRWLCQKQSDCPAQAYALKTYLSSRSNASFTRLKGRARARNRTVAVYAPSKTFNLAGLVGSYHIIYNKYIRERRAEHGGVDFLLHNLLLHVRKVHAPDAVLVLDQGAVDHVIAVVAQTACKPDICRGMDQKDAMAIDGVDRMSGFDSNALKDGCDVIPMWVADMNFPTCPTIPEAMIERAKHPA